MSVRTNRSTAFRLRHEELELRNMLSGHGLGMHFSPSQLLSSAGNIAMHAAAVASPIVRAAHDSIFGGSENSSQAQQTSLTAQLSDTASGATGTGTLQTGSLFGVPVTLLTVSVKGAAASSSLNVSIGGTAIGQVTTDATGVGTLVLSSNPLGTQLPLPTGFPTNVAAGSTITIGSLTGTFASSANSGHDHEHDDEDSSSPSNGTSLTGQLSDVATGATGTITFNTSTVGGVASTMLTVSVKGAAASSTLDVSLGGIVVGQVTTDATGAGSLTLATNPQGTQLPLPVNFPTNLTSGVSVTVGSLTGTLASVNAEVDTHLSAQLSDTTSGAKASIKFASETEDGTTQTKLKVSVTGAAANTTLDVSIGGTVIGHIMTDANGSGRIVLSSNPHGTQQPLPANFPTNVAAATTVNVGTLSGTFSTATSKAGWLTHASARWHGRR